MIESLKVVLEKIASVKVVAQRYLKIK